MTQQCVNCPGAEDHSTAQCPVMAEASAVVNQQVTAADSLPVGVPDGYMPIPTAEQIADALESVRCFHDMSAELIAPELLANLLAATTVKAEQVQCEVCHGQGEVYSGHDQHFHYFDFQPPEPIMEVCPECGGEEAPSLPAAGSADQPYPEGIVEDLERSDWTPLEALQWYAAGKHFDVADGRTRIIDTGAVASNALKHASLAYLELKGDAELSELRAALSAQKSAHVSVPKREALSNLARDGELIASGWNACLDEFHKLNPGAGRASGLLGWAVSRWEAEVSLRPLHNVHRRSLDDTWRQVIRRLGGNDHELCGPPHDALLNGGEA